MHYDSERMRTVAIATCFRLLADYSSAGQCKNTNTLRIFGVPAEIRTETSSMKVRRNTARTKLLGKVKLSP
jgi:hypothetical protein